MSEREYIADPYFNDRDWGVIEASELAKVRIDLRERRIRDVEAYLTAIFDRLKAGQTCELHYRDGSRITICASVPPGSPAGKVGET